MRFYTGQHQSSLEKSGHRSSRRCSQASCSLGRSSRISTIRFPLANALPVSGGRRSRPAVAPAG